MNRFLRVARPLLALLAAISLSAPSFAEESRIRVVCDDNYPPYSFRDSGGNVQGIIPDQWKAWERATGIGVTFTAMDWDLCLKAIERGDADVIDSVFRTPERELFLDFTPPYAEIEVPVYIHESISGISKPADLRGFRVAVKAGDACVGVLRGLGVGELAEYPSYEAIVAAAKRLDVRAFCIDKPPALYFLYRAGIDRDWREAIHLYEGRFHRGIPKERKPLPGGFDVYDAVVSGFASVPDSEIAAIDRRWFGAAIVQAIDFGWVRLVALVVLGLVGILSAFVIALKFEVRKRTAELAGKVGELEASERKNRAFIAALPDLFLVMDGEGRYRECKSANPDLLIAKEESLIGKTVFEVGIPEEVAEMLMTTIRKALRGGGLVAQEYGLDVPAGSLRFEARAVRMDEDRVLVVARDVTDRWLAEESTAKSLREKEILLKEVHHRVKNNMQVISSLVSLQANILKNEEDRAMMRETQFRIKAMAQIHELLYRSEDISSIDLAEYVRTLVLDVRNHFGEYASVEVAVTVDVDPFPCSIDLAVPLGLLVNEVMTNAMKFAFLDGRGDSIKVTLKAAGDGHFLAIEDDGCGLPADYRERSRSGLGFTLVEMLADQAHGRVVVVTDPASLGAGRGTRVELWF